MATATVTNNFTAGTPAVADDVDQNFTDLVTFLNGSVVHKDGTVTMTGLLTLPSGSDPSTDHQAAKYKQVKPLGALVTRTTQNCVNNTLTKISWNVESRDDGGFWSGGDPTKITVPSGADGIYVILASGDFDRSNYGASAATASDFAELLVRPNGGSVTARDRKFGQTERNDIIGLSVGTMLRLAPTAYIEIEARQNNGEGDTVPITNAQVAMYRIAPL